MLLKSIELFGFKSFADKTIIEFSDGITALLGPNGCGKSNVVDAIKWVLGEQATKSLRAERMEDVIFNGTEDRKAVNVADVGLTMVNEEGLFPIDSAEISIRRRLFRNGESEYYINGQPVLLRDIRELFYDTGIGKSAYSIMEQGRIDRILSDKPEERRTIFEEAAGITRFRIKGQEAERRLEKTEENMRQVESIIGEVKRSHDNLRVQSEKTLVYRDIRDKLFSAELDHTLLRLKGFVEERERREGQLQAKLAARDELKSEIDGINESLEDNLDVVNKMESDLIEHQKRLYGVELEQQNRLSEIRIHQERVTDLTSKIDGDEARHESIEKRIAETNREIEQTRAVISENQARIADVDGNIDSFTTRIHHAEERIAENDHQIGEHETAISNEESRQLELERSLREITDDIVQALDEGLATSGYSQAARKKNEETVESGLAEVGRRVEAARALVNDALHGGSTEKVSKPVSSLFDAAFRAIDEVRKAFSDYSTSVPAFLDDFLAPEGIITRKREIDASVESSRTAIRSHREGIVALAAENASLTAKIKEYRSTLEEMRLNRVRMATQVAAMETSVRERMSTVAEQERSLELQKVALEDARSRLVDAEKRIKALETEAGELATREEKMKGEQKKLELAISRKNEKLVKDERGLKKKMEQLGAAQSLLEKIQVGVAESGAEIRNLYENFRERYSLELSEYESRMLEITETPTQIRNRLSNLRDKERELGPVNLAAPEEFEEVRQRYEFLREQLDDLSEARADLNRVTEEIQSESSALFTETYEKIKRNFHAVFRRLFGGGRAELKLADPTNVLESGVEMYAQPPGKKLENIALLSGGERSMTAVALLFATYMVRPSPFCLLDEIDAALDESNVGRFTNMLMEFGESSQFIVITHNKKTVVSAQTLLGVTMEESGVSKVVSVRIGGREEVHAV